MPKRIYYTLAFLSITLIALEIIWTRIFSAEFYYTFAFLILSLAILGLGTGALLVQMFHSLRRTTQLWWMIAATVALSLAGPVFIFHVGLDFSQLFSNWLMAGKLLLVLLVLGASFMTGGMALACLFRNYHEHMPRLYRADLIGAGIGVLFAVMLMNLIGTPKAVFLAAAPALIAAFMESRHWRTALPVLLALFMAALSFRAEKLLKIERPERAPVIYEHWDAMSKVKVYEYDADFRGINVDNAANSPVYHFDGNWDRPDSMRFQFGIDVSYLIRRFPQCTFLSLGAGGGTDVLQALQEGAREIHAVEINPHINDLMTVGNLADFSGRIYQDPRVRVITEDGRVYVRQFKNKFDVIYSLSSNTFAALASGAFAMAENYLFTTEAFQDYWQALSDSGFLSMEHQFYMPRLVSEVLTALEREGVADPKSHIAIYDLPKMRRHLMLLSKQPLTEEIRANAYGPLAAAAPEDIRPIFPIPDSGRVHLIGQIMEQGWRQVADSARIDISPCSDNRPFCAQLGLWKNFNPANLEKIQPFEFQGFPLAKLIIVIVILITGLIIVPLNLLPYLKTGDKLRAAPWLYFFAIGAGFMIIEVVLIQKYALLIGPSLYGLITVLLTLLLFSGMGSRYAGSVSERMVFPAILLWILLDIICFPWWVALFGGFALPLRMFCAMLLLAPLAFFMGMPFPKAALRVKSLVDWGFAVNGAASVLGSAAVLLVVFAWGYDAGLLLAAMLYLLAFILMRMPSRRWS